MAFGSVSASAAALFGSNGTLFANGSGDVTTLFSKASEMSSRKSVDISIRSLQRERDRLLGFKTNLTPAQNKKLGELKEKILKIEEKSQSIKGLSAEDRKELTRLYNESHRILGKEYVDKKADPRLVALSNNVDKVRAPKLNPVQQKRLDNLMRLRENALSRVAGYPESETGYRFLKNINQQISVLNKPRDISQLSPGEKREYDSLVRKVNDIASVELLLPSRKAIRVEKLSASIDDMTRRSGFSASPQMGVTPGQAARVYASL